MNKCCECANEEICKERRGSHKYCFKPKEQTKEERKRIVKTMSDRDKLSELLSIYLYGNLCDHCGADNDFEKYKLLDMTADYLLANGIIVPPCKVGAEIFGVFDNDDEQRKEIYEGKVLCFSLDENNLLWARMRYKNGLTYWHTIDDFGKTVFLTKEEAEEKLKELGK